MRLQDKVAIVTGGARGIGEAIVRRFVLEGAKVTIADVLGDGSKLASELQEAGYPVIYVHTDVSQAAPIQNMVSETIKAFGKLDIVVNNAAINVPGNVEELDEDVWDRTMQVNVKSMFLMGKYTIPELRKSGGGSIVNMASANSYIAEPRLSAYVTSKGAILMLTKQMALDYAPENIRVNAICPGWVDTSFNDAHADLYGGRDKVLEDLSSLQVLGRPIKPSEIANLALFLASDESSAMIGSPVLMDGGICIH